jgi:hypothetical protein
MWKFDITAKFKYINKNKHDCDTNTDFWSQVREHIRSFPRLPPPTGLTPGPREEFLDASISIRRMYELYRDTYGSLSVKENVYRKVLKSDFDIKFIKTVTTP